MTHPNGTVARAVAASLGALVLLAACATPRTPQWKPLTAADFAQPLTLAKCLELARKSDVRAAQWKARLDTVRAEVVSARTLPNPTFIVEWDDVGLHDPTGASLMTVAKEVGYPVGFWWLRGPKVASAKAAERGETASVRADQRRQAVDVGTAFFSLVADQRRVTLSKDLRDIARESLRLADRKKELGLGSAYDVNRANAEVLQSGSDLADSEGQLRLDQLSFVFALGSERPLFPAVVDPENIPALPPTDGATSNVLPDSLIARALQADHAWAQARATREAAEADVSSQQRAAVPIGNTTLTGGPKKTPEGRSSIWTLEFPIPLFDWNRGGIRKAQAALLTAQAEEEKARRAVTASLSDSWERATSSVFKWRGYARPLLANLEKNQRAAQKLFAAGQIPYTDMLQAQRDLKQAQLKEIGLWRDAAAAIWTLECSLGKHDPATASRR